MFLLLTIWHIIRNYGIILYSSNCSQPWSSLRLTCLLSFLFCRLPIKESLGVALTITFRGLAGERSSDLDSYHVIDCDQAIAVVVFSKMMYWEMVFSIFWSKFIIIQAQTIALPAGFWLFSFKSYYNFPWVLAFYAMFGA